MHRAKDTRNYDRSNRKVHTANERNQGESRLAGAIEVVTLLQSTSIHVKREHVNTRKHYVQHYAEHFFFSCHST